MIDVVSLCGVFLHLLFYHSTCHLHKSRAPATLLRHLAVDPAHRILFVEIRRAGSCSGPPAYSVVTSGGLLSQGYGHGRLGVCLGDDHGGRRSTGARWTRRRAAPAYAFPPDPTFVLLDIPQFQHDFNSLFYISARKSVMLKLFFTRIRRAVCGLLSRRKSL